MEFAVQMKCSACAEEVKAALHGVNGRLMRFPLHSPMLTFV